MNLLKISTNLPYVSSFQVLNLFTLPTINFAMIDFRSRENFNHKSIRGSLNCPISKIKPERKIQKQLFPIFKGYSRYLYKSRKLLSIVLISNKGEEAFLEPIQSSLQQSNYKNVTILSGGFESFESKYPWLCEGNLKQTINLDLFSQSKIHHHIQNLQNEKNRKEIEKQNKFEKQNKKENESENEKEKEKEKEKENGKQKEKIKKIEKEKDSIPKIKTKKNPSNSKPNSPTNQFYTKQRKEVIYKKPITKKNTEVICKHPSEIIPDFLWLGSVRTANNEKVLRLLGIKRIINLSIEVEKENKSDLDLYAKLGIKHRSITFDDKVNVDITQKIERVVNIINENDSKILIHCSMGISRSSAAIIYYLMKFQSLSYQQAFGWVKSCRSLIDPNPGFVKQLKGLEKQLVN
ncbi:dual specificity protein phosphatase [Anaeramoeba flamelloides]|uniref:protein-tyrosine-phosphatase n=1 Tax=Anaeramoeba flamelloides TaxID=1746091 RepID=A0ABQ8XBA6_9EUKA|nr:dual specificity protein phosphatase [Anaeramoeba flamelloides]